jgi:hypothetical protein
VYVGKNHPTYLAGAEAATHSGRIAAGAATAVENLMAGVAGSASAKPRL